MNADEVQWIDGERGPIPIELFKPSDGAAWPTVLVIHELMGLNHDIRRIARRFAQNGYLAACPDLMADGSRIRCIVSALRSLRMGEGPAVKQLDACLDYLETRSDARSVGVVGFCLGGGFATLLATRQRVRAAGVFYGDTRPGDELAHACPIVGGYGARDRRFRSKGEHLARRLAEHGVPHDIAFYPSAGHSYMNQAIGPITRAALRPFTVIAYDEAAAEDSWRRMLAFFQEHLDDSPASR